MVRIPQHKSGKRYDALSVVICETEKEAKERYAITLGRLTAINDWDSISGNIISSSFLLCDEKGQKLNGIPRIGDYIRIDVPGPGTGNGDGFDWVKIENILERSFIHKSLYMIQVRPACCPLNDIEEVAHFFSPEATSNFLVARVGLKVMSGIFGRNESPNTSVQHLSDIVRNQVTAGFAFLRFSDMQWRALINGILK
jgi:hypothetical protein